MKALRKRVLAFFQASLKSLQRFWHRFFFYRTDLHISILEDDSIHYNLSIKNPIDLQKKDRFGLTFELMAKFLYPKELYPYLFSPKNLQLTIEKENKQFFWTIKEFEKQMEVDMLFHLVFQKDCILRDLRKLCLKLEKQGLITKGQKWLGILFEKEIQEGRMGDVYLKWICPVKEYGLFAKKDFPPHTFVGEYVGIVRKFSERKDRNNPYCFEYLLAPGTRAPYTIDAREKGNLVRYINHSADPNLSLHLAYAEGMTHIILLTNRFINKGEELTYDYGPAYWKRREKPIL